jgi:hypothetical protein
VESRAVDADLDARCNTAALLGPGRDAYATTTFIGRGTPLETVRSRAHHVREPLVAQVAETELQRIDVQRIGELVDERFAREGVRSRRERAVGLTPYPASVSGSPYARTFA